MAGALITGAARRIGARLALELADLGYDVALHHRSGREDAERVKAQIEAKGRRCILLQADLDDAAARDALPGLAAEALGPLGALVNSASLFEYDLFESLTPRMWEAHLSANFTAPVFLARRLADVATNGAVIVNMLDFKVFSPNPDHFSYTASRMALAGLIPVLAMALAPKIRVAGIAPGLTLPSGDQTREDFDKAHASAPTGHGSTPDDIARALRFILQTPSYTGQVLTVDGGESLLKRTRDVAYDSEGARRDS